MCSPTLLILVTCVYLLNNVEGASDNYHLRPPAGKKKESK